MPRAAGLCRGCALCRHPPGARVGYAVGIFHCPAAGLKSSWKSRFMAGISNRLRKRMGSGRFHGTFFDERKPQAPPSHATNTRRLTPSLPQGVLMYTLTGEALRVGFALSTSDFGEVDLARDPHTKGSLARSTTANPHSHFIRKSTRMSPPGQPAAKPRPATTLASGGAVYVPCRPRRRRYPTKRHGVAAGHSC